MKFKLTEEHLRLLQCAYVGWQNCEYGAPEIDPKRPYGNSSVEDDICEILMYNPNNSEQREHCAQLHRETETALQIVLNTQSFVPGEYELTHTRKSGHPIWRRVCE